MITGQIKSKIIIESMRFNSGYHLSDAIVYQKTICNRNFDLLCNLTSSIFTSGRSKRNYTQSENGYPFLGNTDIQSNDPIDGCKFVSKKYWNDKNSFLKQGMILTGRVGQETVGSYTYANETMNDCIGSDNIIRIIGNNKVKTGYLYSVLASKYGYALTRRHISGNAQPFVTEEMLGSIPIPIFNESNQEEIHNLIVKASELRVRSNKMLKESREKILSLSNLPHLKNSDFDSYYML